MNTMLVEVVRIHLMKKILLWSAIETHLRMVVSVDLDLLYFFNRSNLSLSYLVCMILWMFEVLMYNCVCFCEREFCWHKSRPRVGFIGFYSDSIRKNGVPTLTSIFSKLHFLRWSTLIAYISVNNWDISNL